MRTQLLPTSRLIVTNPGSFRYCCFALAIYDSWLKYLDGDNVMEMEAREFKNAIALGLGRAVLHLLNRDVHPFREVILDACLHNKAYDPQVEGSRAVYMVDVIRATGEPAFYANAVIRALVEEADGWDTFQRFQIAKLLAQDGNESARKAMYSALSTWSTFDNEVAETFVELEGLAGLVLVVRRIGELLIQNPERWEDDYLLSVASDIYGQEAVESTLNGAAKADPKIRAYLEAVEQNRTLRSQNQRHDPASLTYGEVRSLIEANKASSILHDWAKIASESDLALAAHDLIKETDPRKLKLYLTVFGKRKFPLEPGHLLRLVELPDGPVPRHTLRVLANLEHESIRKLAFSLVDSGSSLRGYAIDLLANNFHDGDHAIIEDWCDTEVELGTLNAFDRSVRDFFAAHPDPECEGRLLVKLYEREPCAHCRSAGVERLIAMGAAPEWLRRESEYDSYADTRELVKHS